ncbi:MAG: NUDIX hydrolase [Deinococcales bacterium]|nr:NUDIX hydrolase [Deinococcales bacterium]
MREVIFDGRIVRLVVLDGKWEVVEHADAVGVLVARGRQVLGVRQPRVAIGRDSWEVPAGLVDPDEDPLRAAAREMAEEAQLGGRFELIARFYTSPGFTDEETYLYELHEAAPVDGTPEADEELTLEWRDALEAWEAIKDGRLATSSVTAVALRHVLAREGVAP